MGVGHKLWIVLGGAFGEMRGAKLAAFSVLLAAPTAAVLAVSLWRIPACCQGKGIFELPKVELTQAKPPEACASALERGNALLEELDKMLAEDAKATLRKVVSERDKEQTEAESWDYAATVALVNLYPAAALWCELNALKLEWNPKYAEQAGVYLALFQRSDDAKLFLHCAYEGGDRSATLFEALANVYHTVGDKPKAVQYIGDARRAAPDDRFIEVQQSLFTNGRTPTPRANEDLVDAAMRELREQMDKSVAINKRAWQLQEKVEKIYFEESTTDAQSLAASLRQGYDAHLQGLAEQAKLAKQSLAQIRAQGQPPELLAAYRNGFFYTAIRGFITTTQDILRETRITIAEGFDVGFWAGPMGLDVQQYTRMLKQLRDFEFAGIALKTSGYKHEDWGGAQFYTFYRHAEKLRSDGHRQCFQTYPSNQEALDRCVLEVDQKYCATVRSLHENWMNTTEGLVQKLGRNYDNAASAELIQAGAYAEEAYNYAVKYAKGMNVQPGAGTGSAFARQMNKQAQEWVAELNKLFVETVHMAVGSGDGGAAQQVKEEGERYQLYRANAETAIGQYKRTIEEMCQPVDQRVLEQLLEEHRRAVSAMLLERLLRDFNAKWNPNANCNFKVGKWFSMNVDIDGNVEFGGRWGNMLKAMGGEKLVFEGPGSSKIDLNEKSIGWTAKKEVERNGGIFTGSGEVTGGIAIDPKTGQVSFPVKVEAKLGVGFKRKTKDGTEYEFSCYPGEFEAKFDVRVIAADAAKYLQSLKR
jgi:hypothetical protein